MHEKDGLLGFGQKAHEWGIFEEDRQFKSSELDFDEELMFIFKVHADK